MHKLIKLLQANLDADDADAVPATVENVVKESSQTEQATSRLNLTKSLYSQRFSVTLVLPATNIGMQMTADAAPHAG